MTEANPPVMPSQDPSLRQSLTLSPGKPLCSKWRFLLTPGLSGPENMALDMALMDRARRTGDAVFRVYTWRAPTLSFGRNQNARGRYHLDKLESMGAEIVRRPTGGRAILHLHEVTYSVTAPENSALTLKASYDRINTILLDALQRLNVDASVVEHTGRSPRPTTMPCFAVPGKGEMIADGRKLVGSAQWRENGALLQHGSILVDDDQTLLASLMQHPPDSLPVPATLSDLLGRAPSVEEVSAALFEAVREVEDPAADEITLDEVLHSDPPPVEFFLSDEWTWRR